MEKPRSFSTWRRSALSSVWTKTNYYQTAVLDPSGFVAALPDATTIDEVQRFPALLPAIKRTVDRDRRPGRFLLTGSANLLLVPTVTESLAGRMEIVQLQPLTEAEKEGKRGRFLIALLEGALKPSIRPGTTTAGPALAERLVAGGYPEPLTRAPVPRPTMASAVFARHHRAGREGGGSGQGRS